MISRRMMQTSIIRFLKAKQEPVVDKGAATGVVKQPVNQSFELKQLPTNTPVKRKLDQDRDQEEEGEGNVEQIKLFEMTTTHIQNNEKIDGDQKAQMTSSLNSDNKDKQENKQNDIESRPLKKAAMLLTPGGSKPVASPLMDFRVVIRKKIAEGAFALHENIGISWFKALQSEFDKTYFKNLSAFVQKERNLNTVFPPEEKVYSWTHYFDIKDTKVVILGQDPYHAPGQAHGLCFSVVKGIRNPPSLINIYKELENNFPGFVPPSNGDLTGWAKQGVLLLNTCLTVNKGQANSHKGSGWETFTDAVISYISKNIKHDVVFILWGRPAQNKASMINKRHLILKSAHPSPLSAHNGFFGCRHFAKANEFLKKQNLRPIDWKSL